MAGSGESGEKNPSEAEAALILGFTARLKRLLKKAEDQVNLAKSEPSGAKARVHLQVLSTGRSPYPSAQEVFSSL